MNNFSENIKRIRKDNNLSQEQLADILGVSRQAISKWESKVAYPEMEKILMICEKFNVSIDDLLHKDIKEINGEKESRNKINTHIHNFLKGVTNFVNMFFNMSFKTKVKFILEQIFIIIILVILSSLIMSFFKYFFNQLFSIIGDYMIRRIIVTTLNIFISFMCFVSTIVIVIYIYKSRYLNYYVDYKSKSNAETIKEENNNKEMNNEFYNREKIIIRNQDNNDNILLNSTINILKYSFKFFILLIICTIIPSIFLLFFLLFMSFLISKSGLLFIGILLFIISLIIIGILFLTIFLNILFDRKNNKKRNIYIFLLSIILMGIGFGTVSLGLYKLEYLYDNDKMYVTRIIRFKMNNKLNFYTNIDINYIEDDIKDIKVEYIINKKCDLNYTVSSHNLKNIYFYPRCNSFTLENVKEHIENINNKKIIRIKNEIQTIKIYASKKNIEILKENYQKKDTWRR